MRMLIAAASIVMLCAVEASASGSGMTAAELLEMCDDTVEKSEAEEVLGRVGCMYFLQGAIAAVSAQAFLNPGTSAVCLPDEGVTIVEVRDGVMHHLRRSGREPGFHELSARVAIMSALASLYACPVERRPAQHTAALCTDERSCIVIGKFALESMCQGFVATQFPEAVCARPMEPLQAAFLRRYPPNPRQAEQAPRTRKPVAP